jgi:hypothetical protein
MVTTWTPNAVGGRDGVPKRLFHGTSPDNVQSIFATSLEPRRVTHLSHRPDLEPSVGVFLTTSWGLARWKGTVLVVDVRGLDLVRINHWNYASLAAIEPDRIQVLGG